MNSQIKVIRCIGEDNLELTIAHYFKLHWRIFNIITLSAMANHDPIYSLILKKD